MDKKIKKIFKDIIPPFAVRAFQKPNLYGFFGDYESWQEAVADSKGYDDPAILEKVRSAVMKVKTGEAAYERDSVVFDRVEYSWPVLASLLWAASQKGNRLNVLDFGGSLGSSYFQNRGFLGHLAELRWNIVEQKNFTECGRKGFEDGRLKFFGTIEECLAETKPDAVLLSSVIQYLEKPYEFARALAGYGFGFVIFDRTAFAAGGGRDRLTVQKVPPRIYDASYPAWFLDEAKFLDIFAERYELVADFDSLGGTMEIRGKGGHATGREKGFTFMKKQL